MKFLGSSIPTVNFNIVLGNNTGGYLYNDTLKKLVHTDNTLEFVNFGARKERIANIKLVQIDESDYQTIKDYLINNSGKKVQIEGQSGEEIFGPNIATTFYAYLLNFNLDGEQAFSSTNGLYEIELSLSYSGTGSTDEINTVSTIDFLIEVEPNLIGITNNLALISDLASVSSPSEGDSSYVQEDKRVYYYNGSSWIQIDKGVNLQQKIVDDPDLGLLNGVFRWAAFSTTQLTETYYNKFVLENATVGYDTTIQTVHTDDTETRRRQGIAIRQSDGMILISGSTGSAVINNGDTLCLRFNDGSTTPDAETTIYSSGGDSYIGEGIIYHSFNDSWIVFIGKGSPTYAGKVAYSTDDGANWTISSSSITGEPRGMVSMNDGRLVMVTSNTSTWYLYYSTDNGSTWSQGFSVAASLCLTTRSGIVYNPDDDAIYFYVRGDGVYKSLDGGVTATLVSDDTVVNIGLNRSHKMVKKDDAFYMCGSHFSGSHTYVFKSTDNCVSWDRIITVQTSPVGEFEDIIIDNNGHVYAFREYFSGIYYTEVYRITAGTSLSESIGTNSNARIDENVINETSGIIYSSYSDTSTNLPTFQTISVSNALTSNNNFLTGIINKNSIRFPTSNINIDQGPAVSTPQGFKFAIDNSSRRHIDLEKYNFFGAKVRFYVYDNTSGADQKVLIRSGVNKNNSIDYYNYEFDVEPSYLFNKDFVIPDKVLEGSDLTSISGQVSEEFKGLPLPLSYGRWNYARMQNVIFDNQPSELLTVNGQDSLIFYVYSVVIESGYQKIETNISTDSVNDDFKNNAGTNFVNVVFSGGSGTGSSRIFAYEAIQASGRVKIWLPNGVDLGLQAGDRIEIVSRSIKFAIDEVKCKGFTTSQKSPKVYYFDEEQDKYIQYPEGLFIADEDNTGIEKTTQLSINVRAFNNGLSSLEDKKLTLSKVYKDDLRNDIYTNVIEGTAIAQHIPVGANDIAGIEKIDLIMPNEGSTELLLIRNSGAYDGGSATTGGIFAKYEKTYRENFGNNSHLNKLTNNSYRWFLVNYAWINSETNRRVTNTLDAQSNGGNLNAIRIDYKSWADRFNANSIYNEGAAFVRYFQVDQDMRDKLIGAQNVNLLLTQVIKEFTLRKSSVAIDNYVDGVFVTVQVIFNDNTKSTAFSGSFSDSLLNVTEGDSSFICINNKPSWLGGTVDGDYTGSGTTTLSSGVTCHIGKELITLNSSLFDSGSYLFGNAVAIQVSFTPISSFSFPTKPDVSRVSFEVSGFYNGISGVSIDTARKDIDITEMYISYEKEFDIEKGTFYVKLDGGRVDSDENILESPQEIATNIFDKKLNKELSFTGLTGRETWKTRKQFFENQKVSDITREIANNLFCSAVIKDDGSINFKSLVTTDYSQPVITFDDSIVLKDSVSKIKFRKSTEIYNKFVFNYYWDWAKKEYKNQVVIYLDSNNQLQIDGIDDIFSNPIKVRYQDYFVFSKNYFSTGEEVTKTIDLEWFYSESLNSVSSVYGYIQKCLNYYIFNAWEFSFDVPMSYTIYNTNVNGNKVVEGDFIRFKSYFYSNNVNVDGFVKGIKPDYYNGRSKITMFSALPPEIINNFYDYRWDGETGDISSNLIDYQIQVSDLWPFKDASQVGTYPTGNTGDISASINDYQFDDDTYADSDEDYNPFDF